MTTFLDKFATFCQILGQIIQLWTKEGLAEEDLQALLSNKFVRADALEAARSWALNRVIKSMEGVTLEGYDIAIDLYKSRRPPRSIIDFERNYGYTQRILTRDVFKKSLNNIVRIRFLQNNKKVTDYIFYVLVGNDEIAHFDVYKRVENRFKLEWSSNRVNLNFRYSNVKFLAFVMKQHLYKLCVPEYHRH